MKKSMIMMLCMTTLLIGSAEAKPRPRSKISLTPSHESLLRQNWAIDQMGLVRIQNEDELTRLVEQGVLVALPSNNSLAIARGLPANRRYALPLTISFLLSLSGAYRAEFGKPLMVDSAVRPRSVQERLRRTNYAAAPADGETASSHMAGTTFDISKNMTPTQRHWLEAMLSYEVAENHAIVENERACYHIQVIGETQ
jgi:hypothetical protein